MTQGVRIPSGPRSISIPPATRPSAEHVRALEAAGLLEVNLLKKSVQRPLMSVWEGEDRDHDRVLLTVVDACGTPREQGRVMAAAKALQALSGTPYVQNVRRVLDAVDAFVSDFHGAGTASDLVVLRWPILKKLDFVCRVAEGLAALHEAGITHGCLCPDNILLDDDLRPVVTEAGMVSIAESLEGDRENFFGYGAFASPEAADGRPDSCGDVFSVGRLLTFVLLDRAPGETVDVMDVNAKSPELANIVRRSTGSISDRHQSMGALLAELQRCRQVLVPTDGDTTKRPTVAPAGPVAPGAPALPVARRTARPPTPASAFQPGSKKAQPPKAAIRWLVPLLAVLLLGGGAGVWLTQGPDAGGRGMAARDRAVKGKKDFHGERLQGANLADLDLTGADLERADLTSANLARSKLVHAGVSAASFVMAHFEGADLDGVDLAKAYGVETATCDDSTVLPAGWSCDAGRLKRGKKSSPSAP